jgi:hypothetical protein
VLQVERELADNFRVLVFNGAEQRETFFEIPVVPTLAIEDGGPITQSFFGRSLRWKFKIVAEVCHFSPLWVLLIVKALLRGRGDGRRFGGWNGWVSIKSVK